MTKQIQAYFNTEDEAESAKTKLLSFKTENLEVGSLGAPLGRTNRVLLPIAPVNMAGNMNMGGAVGSMGVPGAAYGEPGVPIVEDLDHKPDDRDLEPRNDSVIDASDSDPDLSHLNYVLSAKVEEDEYDDIVQKLRSNGAHVEVFD
ncbi:hypothetical protein [Paenibacillus pini]|uniref:Uncharacterized protein n=1 Tax=Paenibacillus pini JCM 16418 TaxID=1236976 RepID=W7YE55_9BACL|nr:hypothetical protein [Paenibacillus pini]GAF06772.1 hypothetical protein JCM16418_753 [Paenibacillus pini JCM 16418]